MLRNVGCLVLLGVMLSCTYEPDDEAYHKINKPDPRPFEINFFNTTDTLYAGGAMVLNFNPPENKDLKATVILLDNTPIMTAEGAIDSYLLDPETLPAGYAALTVRYYQKTGSGSLADLADSEFFEFEFSRPVLIDNAPVRMLQIVKTAVIDSTLVIYWNKFTGYKFTSYVVNHNYGSAVITDQEVDHLAVPDYPGGELSVAFQLNAKDRTVGSQEFYHEGMSFAAQPIGVDSLHLSWDRSRYRAFRGMRISFNDNGFELPVSQFDFHTRTRAVDTTVYFPVGLPFNYYINATAETPQGYYLPINPTSLLQSPEASGATPNLLRFKQGNTRLMLYYNAGSTENDRDRISLYEGNTAVKTIGGKAMSISYDGKHVIRASMSVTNQLFLEKIDPETLNLIEDRMIPVTPGTQTLIFAVLVSSDEYVLVTYNTSTTMRYIVYHWPTQTIVHSGTAPVNNQPAKGGWLADGGRYYVNGQTYGDLSITPLDTRSLSSPGSPQSLPHRNQYIYQFDNIFRLREFMGSVIRTIPVEGTVLNSIANEGHHLGVMVQKPDGSHYFEVYDIDTGFFVERVKIRAGVVAPGNYGYRFSGNQLWLQTGSTILHKYIYKFNFSL